MLVRQRELHSARVTSSTCFPRDQLDARIEERTQIRSDSRPGASKQRVRLRHYGIQEKAHPIRTDYIARDGVQSASLSRP